MKFKKKNRAPLSHSNLTEHENLRSHYDPNGSWTGVPDGWDKDVEFGDEKSKREGDVESGRDVYGDFKPTENGYVQSDKHDAGYCSGCTGYDRGHGYGGFGKRDTGTDGERSVAEYPLEGQVAPADGDSYAQNTRDMQDHAYPRHTNGNGMADIEAGEDFYHEKLNAEAGEDINGQYDSDVEGGEDIYQNDIDFDPAKYESGEWKKSPEECPAPKRDVETGSELSPDADGEISSKVGDIKNGAGSEYGDVEGGADMSASGGIGIGSSLYPFGSEGMPVVGNGYSFGNADEPASDGIYPRGDVGTPVSADGYPSVPDGELTMEQAGVREDAIPVQDADDL